MIIKMVIINGENEAQYLTRSKDWTSKKDSAWEYTTDLVFAHAGDHHGKVYLRLPTGREIEVCEGDFLS